MFKYIGVIALLAMCGSVDAGDGILFKYGRLDGFVSAETRMFYHGELYQYQETGLSASVTANPEYSMEWVDDSSMKIKPFVRLDSIDDERSYFELREAYWNKPNIKLFGQALELRVGLDQVNWWTTESQHLVDIINQVDLVDHPNGEVKLGQPMIRLLTRTNAAEFSVYVLPYFRERKLPGKEGRLRFQIPFDNSNAFYQSSDKENHIDYAIRYSATIDDLDYGLSFFKGTGREPTFVLGGTINNPLLVPYYQQITQYGLDFTYAQNAWLWKMELIKRSDQNNAQGIVEDYLAHTSGFELDISDMLSGKDIGLLVEWLYDDRGEVGTTTGFDNDFFLGLRFANNDAQGTEMILGVIQDLSQGTNLLVLEGERRIGKDMKLFFDLNMFNHVDQGDSVFRQIRNDDFIQFRLAYFY